MDLNFVLEHYTAIFFSSVVVVLGLSLMFLFGFVGIFKVIFYKKTRSLSNVKLSYVLIIGLICMMFMFGSYQGIGYLRGLVQFAGQEITIDSDYKVKIVKTGSLSLKKKTLVSVHKLETTKVNGIGIEKRVLSQEEDYVHVLTVKCGDLSFDECLVKTKENLATITAGMDNKSMQVVQF